MKKYLFNFVIFAISLVTFGACSSDEPIVVEKRDVPELAQNSSQPENSVSDADIDDVVTAFLGYENVSARSGEYVKSLVRDEISGKPLYYIVEFGGNNGYMLLSATKDFQPVLAYVKKGSYNPQSYIQAGLAEWLIETKEAIAESATASDTVRSNARKLWSAYARHTDVKLREESAGSRSADIGNKYNHPELIPIMEDSTRVWQSRGWEVIAFEDYDFTTPSRDEMIQNMQSAADWRYIEDAAALTLIVRKVKETVQHAHDLDGIEWEQIWPWNMSFPRIEISKNNYDYAYVGCVPLAGGQLMRYHRYPAKYDWDSMPAKYTGRIDWIEPASTFLLEIARAVNAKFTKDGTEAHTMDLVDVFKRNGYIVKTGTTFGSVGLPCVVRKSTSLTEGHAYILVSKFSIQRVETVECWTFMQKNRMDPCYLLKNDISGATMHYINWGYGGDNGLYYNAETANPPSKPNWKNSKISNYIYIQKP